MVANAMDASLHDRIVLFDGVCDLCNGFVQFIIRRDPKARFRFGTLQSEEAKGLLRGSTIRADALATVVYLRNGRPLTRSTAALRILGDLGGGWTLCLALLAVPPFLRDAVYRWIARKRYAWFGKRDACMVPTPELRVRFIGGLRG